MKKITYGTIITNILLILVSLSCVLPLIMVISISFSSEEAITKYGYALFPKVLSISAYGKAFENPHQLVTSYQITIAYSIIATILSLIVQSLMAYALSRKTYNLRKFATVYIFITMLFSGGLVPSYILISQYLHMNNTFWVYVFPGLVSAWNIIIIRTFFKGLPDSLVEGAKIDGASEFRVYFQIILPLSKPVLATIGFMTLLGKWNDWYTSLIYIRDSELYSLQYLLQRILREAEFVKSMSNNATGSLLSENDLPTESLRFAMAVLAAGPMLVIFPFFQKYFVRGLTVGAVKG